MKLRWFWRQSAPEVKLLLKRVKRSWRNGAPEDYRFWRQEVQKPHHQKLHHQKLQKLLHQKLPHQKSFHQKLKINWICKTFKDWRIYIAKAVYWIRKHSRKLVEHCNGHFKGVWRHVLAIWTKALTLYYCTNCTTTFSTTLFCVHATRQENSFRIRLRLHRCSFG